MLKKVGEKLNAGKWFIVSALVPVVIIAVVFAIPFKTVPVHETETYWATELIEEAYTVTEDYTTTELYEETETKSETVYDSYLASGNSYTFEVDRPDSTVTVKMSGYPYGGYYASYVVIDETNPYYYPYWPNYYWDSRAKVTITLSYPDQVTRERLVTKQREVVKYRDVPTQVLKEHVTTKYVKMSIWQYLFMDR